MLSQMKLEMLPQIADTAQQRGRLVGTVLPPDVLPRH